MYSELDKSLQDCEFFTIKDTGIKELSEKEKSKFDKTLGCLEYATQFSKKNRNTTVTFRGINESDLRERLNDEYSLSKIFVVGDKAALFYQIDENESTKNFLTSIQDYTPTTLDYAMFNFELILQNVKENFLTVYSKKHQWYEPVFSL